MRVRERIPEIQEGLASRVIGEPEFYRDEDGVIGNYEGNDGGPFFCDGAVDPKGPFKPDISSWRREGGYQAKRCVGVWGRGGMAGRDDRGGQDRCIAGGGCRRGERRGQWLHEG